MGITGLLKGLQCFSKKQHVRDFSHQTLAVDASSWLHRSVYSIAERHVESLERSSNDGHPLDSRCVQTSTKYMVSRCRELLLNAQIARIYLVLDGCRCPLKVQTNRDREDRRQKNLAEARKFRGAGRPDKAEEKYKACIKIPSAFASAVADAVMRQFANDARVQCVFSPYEADAQLVHLCLSNAANAIVTEDSDVLVYLASCRRSFPILFKLERHTGSCDVISMDWLLSQDTTTSMPQHGSQQQKKASAMESILRSLASRESRKPGAGARLFVQACVLAGCDYAPSRLNGVGLVTAFKLLRDNAHRPPAKRFRHALSSLSKKARGKEDMETYEEILAKSEAVFFYHPVIHLGARKVVTLNDPLLEDPLDEEGASDVVADYRPSMQRFASDWSFLGDFDAGNPFQPVSPVAAKSDRAPVAEIVIPQKKSPSRRRKRHTERQEDPIFDAGEREIENIVSIVNPYKKTKKRKLNDHAAHKRAGSSREPLSDLASDFKPNQTTQKNDISIYFSNKKDVRFVKPKYAKDGKRVLNTKPATNRKPARFTRPLVSATQRVLIDIQDLAEPEANPAEVEQAVDYQTATFQQDDGFFQEGDDAGCENDENHITDIFSDRTIPRCNIAETGSFLYDCQSRGGEDYSDVSKNVRRVTLDGPQDELASPISNEFEAAHLNGGDNVAPTESFSTTNQIHSVDDLTEDISQPRSTGPTQLQFDEANFQGSHNIARPESSIARNLIGFYDDYFEDASSPKSQAPTPFQIHTSNFRGTDNIAPAESLTGGDLIGIDDDHIEDVTPPKLTGPTPFQLNTATLNMTDNIAPAETSIARDPIVFNDDFIEDFSPFRYTGPSPFQNDFSWATKQSPRLTPRASTPRKPLNFVLGSTTKSRAGSSIREAFARQRSLYSSDIESPASSSQRSRRHHGRQNSTQNSGAITHYFQSVVRSPEHSAFDYDF